MTGGSPPPRRAAAPRAQAAGTRAARHIRLRFDPTDRDGRITLPLAGQLDHLIVDAALARRRFLAIADERNVTVVAREGHRPASLPEDSSPRRPSA